MVVIIFNIIVMALNSPLLEEHGKEKIFIHNSETVFTCIYGVEIIIKIIANGFYCKGGYFRGTKNLIDFSLFLLNISTFFLTDLGMLNALRAFHIFVLFKHFESMKIILISLYKSLPHLLKLCFFSFCFILIFGKSLFHILSYYNFIYSYYSSQSFEREDVSLCYHR